MVFLRSRTRTGLDRIFHAYSRPPPITSGCRVLRYPLRVLQCRVFDPEKAVLFAPYIGYVGHTLGFSGEGRTIHETAEDSCRKLISYIESRVAGQWPPYHPECIDSHCTCIHLCGKFEQEMEMEIIDAPDEMEWVQRFDCEILAVIDEDTGIVKQVGWSELELESGSSWYIWREPSFSSLS